MGRLRSSVSFGASGTVHGALLVWLAIAAANTPREAPKSLYDQEIRPFENHIVWYNLREKLPDIKPVPAAATPAAPKRPRALRKFQQTLISGSKDDSKVPQTIVTDAPPAELPKPLPLPNVVAEAGPPPAPPRIFAPPPEPPPPDVAPPMLPDSPPAQAKPTADRDPLGTSTPRPQPLPFQAPPEKPPVTDGGPPPELPEAPRVAAAKPPTPGAPLGASTPRPRPLPFQVPAPLERPRTAAPITLPEAPGVASTRSSPPSAPLGYTTPRPQPKAFTGPPPLASTAPSTSLVLPEAPASAASATAGLVAAPRIPRSFPAPPARTAAKEPAPAIANPAPAVTSPGAAGTESFAIAGLDPSKYAEIPALPASHPAGFSGAPEVNPDTGAPASNERASLVVPSLTAGGGVRDALPTMAPAPEPPARSGRLLAALRDPLSPRLPAPPDPNAPKALRVSSTPDPRMQGRVVYTMAIQMPNVTSYSGSWMVWFAEHIPEPGAAPVAIRPPVPRHKVDPAYIRSAADERIEGVVRLAAVIGKDGRMDQIEVLSGIDARLDRSAEDALGKWLFQPALRDGVPIDVDAVFEVPFRLAPKPSR